MTPSHAAHRCNPSPMSRRAAAGCRCRSRPRDHRAAHAVHATRRRSGWRRIRTVRCPSATSGRPACAGDPRRSRRDRARAHRCGTGPRSWHGRRQWQHRRATRASPTHRRRRHAAGRRQHCRVGRSVGPPSHRGPRRLRSATMLRANRGRVRDPAPAARWRRRASAARRKGSETDGTKGRGALWTACSTRGGDGAPPARRLDWNAGMRRCRWCGGMAERRPACS